MMMNEALHEISTKVFRHDNNNVNMTVSQETYRMIIVALNKQVPKSLYPDGDTSVEVCPICGSGEYLYNEDGNMNNFCGQCGTALDRSDGEENV